MIGEFLDKDGVLTLWEKVKLTVSNSIVKHLPWESITNKPEIVTQEEFDWEHIKNKPDIALKSDISTVYKYKGSVETAIDLPTAEMSESTIGWVYNVEADGSNWAWSEYGWDSLGQIMDIQSISSETIDSITSDDTLEITQSNEKSSMQVFLDATGLMYFWRKISALVGTKQNKISFGEEAPPDSLQTGDIYIQYE